MQIIALDVGTKRIGVAKADTSVKIAIPDGTIVVNGDEFAEIARILKRYKTDWVVLGLPRNSQGLETAQSEYVREFAKKLKLKVPTAKIRFQDESLTSVEAERRLKARKGNRFAKGEVDTEAATIILQDFIETYAAAVQLEANQSDEPRSTTKAAAKSATKPATKAATSVATPIDNRKTPSKAPESDFKAPMAKKATSTMKTPKIATNPLYAAPSDTLFPESTQNIEKKTHKSKKPLKIGIIIGVVILALGLGGFCGFLWYNAQLGPVTSGVSCKDDPENEACKSLSFSVKTGETTSKIADNLKSAGLIRNSLAFQIYYRLNFDQKDSMKVGDYRLNRTMSTHDIIKNLVEGEHESNVFSLTVLPGETVASVKKKLINEHGYKKEEVDAAFAADYDHPIFKDRANTSEYGAEPLEGYLFGDTYEFYKGESVGKIIETMLDALWGVVNNNHLEEKFAEHGLNLYQGITLASIVQKEAKDTDQAQVAKVFLNRLGANMPLGSDVTTQYALDLVDPERKAYTNNAAALKVDSRYNTRLYAGLTPGPISNPGTSALLAVANPADSNALYFLTGDDGMMYYSNTDAGHNQNIRDHCQKLCNVSL